MMIKTKKKYTIKEIFKDHWLLFLAYMFSKQKEIRDTILHEVDRILSCQENSSGYSLYGCEYCNTVMYVPFTCKSRFCNCCGSLYSTNRAKSIKSKLLKCNHRHIIFTIPEELRIYLLKDRKLLNCLFSASSKTLLNWFCGQSKTRHFVPGIVSVLHTFGRDLKWNPHIHAIVTEGAYDNNFVWKDFSYIPFEMLRKKWRFLLLEALEVKIPSSDFKTLKNTLYKKYPNGFYVNAVKKPIMFEGLIDYIVRYIGRPVMAQSRIIDYDKVSVTFWYQPHGAKEKVVEKISVFDFIARLIRHIPEQHFKMLRYYGLYTPSNAHNQTIKRVLNRSNPIMSTWRQNIINSFSKDPLICSVCGNVMELLLVIHPKKSSDKKFTLDWNDT